MKSCKYNVYSIIIPFPKNICCQNSYFATGVQAPVVRKLMSANPRLNRTSPRSKFIL